MIDSDDTSDPGNVRVTYFVAIRGDSRMMRDEASRTARGCVARLVLDAAIAQNESRADRCRTLYERALKSATPAQLPYVVDLISPFLMMSENYERYQALRDACDVEPELAGAFAAMDAIRAARLGDAASSLGASDAALAFASESENEVLNGRILQRLAYAALHRGDFVQAEEMATSAARTLECVGAFRAAATAYSIAYNVHHAGTGDFERAEIFADKIIEAARRSGDTSLENAGLIARYEMACESGNDGVALALRRRIDALALPEQYAERFARGVGDVILAAAANDLAAFHANAVLLREVLAADRPAVALASALCSLGAVAIGDVAAARRYSRNALGLAALSDATETAHGSRYRQLARALAASTCTLIGDHVRAQRATERRIAHDKHGLLMLVRIAAGGGSELVPRRIRGYARVVETVRAAVLKSHRHSQLSEAEHTVLTLLAQGLNAPQIAKESGRSVHTIHAHTRSIIAKLGVRGKSAAIAFAQEHGLLSK